jgi:phospholipase/carboxylesterase
MAMGIKARDFLKSQGYALEWHEYPMPHSVCPAEVMDIRRFLHRVLPA